MACLVSWLPPCLRLWLGYRGFLPRVVILKEVNPKRPWKLLDELKAYDQARSLQGGPIPQVYGEVTVYNGIDRVPAFLVEHVDGSTLENLPLEHLASNAAWLAIQNGKNPSNDLDPESILHPDLLAALRLVYDELTTKNMVHGDPKPDNFLATVSRDGEYRVRAIDLEYAHPPDCTTNSTDFLSVVYWLAETIAPDEIID